MFSFDVSRSDHQLLMVSPHHTSSSRGPSLSPVTRPPWLSRLWDQVCLKLSNHLQVLVTSSSAPTSSCAQRPLDVLYLGQIKASTSPSIRRPRPSSPCEDLTSPSPRQVRSSGPQQINKQEQQFWRLPVITIWPSSNLIKSLYLLLFSAWNKIKIVMNKCPLTDVVA